MVVLEAKQHVEGIDIILVKFEINRNLKGLIIHLLMVRCTMVQKNKQI